MKDTEHHYTSITVDNYSLPNSWLTHLVILYFGNLKPFMRTFATMTNSETLLFAVFIVTLMVGVNYGWTSPFIGKLTRPNPPFEADNEQISWIASLINLSRPIGVIGGTIVTRYFGSKNAVVVSGVCFLASWINLALSSSIEIVYITYIICGAAIGLITTVLPIFISEIATPTIRGSLISLSFQGLLVGIFVGNLMGTHLDPWFMAVMLIVPTVFFLCTFPWFHGTPFYFLYKNDLERAKKSLEWYNPKKDISEEFEKLIDFVKSSPNTTFIKSIVKFMEPINRNTLLIVNVIYSLIQLNGFFTLVEYMEVLYASARITILTPASLVTIVCTISIVTSWIAVYITDKFGRVTLLFSSFFVMALALYGWGLAYHLLDLGFTESWLNWIVITTSSIYRVSIVFGFTTVAPVLIGELFAPNIKGYAICFCNITLAICSFISNKNFQLMVDTLTHKYVFYIYATVTLIVSFYCKIFVPETRGKSLIEIQEMLKRRFVKKTKADSEIQTDGR